MLLCEAAVRHGTTQQTFLEWLENIAKAIFPSSMIIVVGWLPKRPYMVNARPSSTSNKEDKTMNFCHIFHWVSKYRGRTIDIRERAGHREREKRKIGFQILLCITEDIMLE